ncbi:MAG: hypothetical protein OXR73_04395 [Myxococcales bacterium]|nr:hypothetical protein [Myxococcales bacterium]
MRRLAWFALLLSVGCSDSCLGCSEGQPRPEANRTKPSPKPKPKPAVIETDGGIEGVRPPQLTVHHKQREAGPELEALQAVKQRLKRSMAVRDTLASPKQLAGALPDQLGTFMAQAEATEGPTQALGQSIRGVKRTYRDGSRAAIVKVTDAGKSPGLLTPVLDRLTFVGEAPVGSERGVLIGESPAIVSHYAEHQNSRLTAIVDGHLLIEVRISGTDDPDAARKLFDRLTF